MSFLRKNREEEYEDEYEEEERPQRRIRDLAPKNKRKRKEPPKPWGKKERYIVLGLLSLTIFTSAILAISARDFKLPGLPRLSTDFKDFKFNIFKEETITIGKGTPEQKKKADLIISDFEAKTKGLSGTYTLYVIDLSNGYSFGVDENKVMQAASLIKLPIMLYVSGKVDDDKIEAMGKRSDNAIFTEIRNEFGDKVLQDNITSLGMVDTSITENLTTPKEIGDLLKRIYEEDNELILNSITDTIFEEWLTPGIPEGTRISHKYGREVHVVNDAGIIYSQNPFVIVIMTQGVVEKEADQVFPELSKLVYDGMTK